MLHSTTFYLGEGCPTTFPVVSGRWRSSEPWFFANILALSDNYTGSVAAHSCAPPPEKDRTFARSTKVLISNNRIENG